MFLVLNSIKRPKTNTPRKSRGFNPQVIWKQKDVNFYIFFANLFIYIDYKI